MDEHFDFTESLLGGFEKDCAFDQPCKFGNRVGHHAVYCHNKEWKDAPRKCRRTWCTNGEKRDEDCPGFEINDLKDKVKEP